MPKKKTVSCKWLRNFKPIPVTAKASVKDKSGYEYIGLTNGQVVHRDIAKKRGLIA
mgnify:CR=1 FL=1